MGRGRLNNEVRLNVQLKRSIYDRLREISEEEGRSISDIIRVMIADYIWEYDRRNKELIEKEG